MSLNSIPIDVLRIVLKEVPKRNWIFLSSTCKTWKNIVGPTKKASLDEIVDYCAGNNYISLLDWLWAHYKKQKFTCCLSNVQAIFVREGLHGDTLLTFTTNTGKA